MKLPVRRAFLEGFPLPLAVLDESGRRSRVSSRVDEQAGAADEILGPINGWGAHAIESASLTIEHQ
jgi:hypothetical protein